MGKILWVVFMGLFPVVGFAQIWQSTYDSCLYYQEQQDFNKALYWGDVCLKLYETQTPKKDTSYSNILNRQFESCFYSGQYEKGFFYAKKDSIWVVQQLGKNVASYGLACNNLGLLYQQTGRYHLAEVLFKEDNVICEKILGTNHVDYAASCTNIGLLYQDIGQYPLAEQFLLKAAKIYLQAVGRNHGDYALTQNNLGLLYNAMGQYALAEPAFKEFKEICAQTVGKEHTSYAMACNNLGFLYQNNKQYVLAESLLKTAANIYEKTGGKNHPDYALAQNNLGILYYNMKQYAVAEPFFKESKELYEKLLGKTHPDYAKACNNLASIYQNTGNYPLAERLYLEAKQIRAEYLGIYHPDYASSCNNLATLYESMGRIGSAQQLYEEASTLKLKELKRNFIILTETQKEDYIKANEYAFQNTYSFMVHQNKAYPYLYDLIINTKGMIVNGTQTLKEHILNSSDTNLVHTYEQWQNVNKTIASLYSTPVDAHTNKTKEIDSLQKKAGILEKKLNQVSEEFSDLNKEVQLTHQDIQHQLKQDEVAIEIIRVDLKEGAKYAAVILTKQQVPVLVVLPTLGSELEKEYLINYRRSTRHKFEDTLSYNAYWKPINAYLQKNQIKKVYFSPEGVYNVLNVNTFYNSSTRKYVFEEYAVVQVTNTKEILSTTQNKPLTRAVLVGYPDFKAKTKYADTERGKYLNALEGTKTEISNIAQIMAKQQLNTQKIMGQQATKDTALHQIRPSILHIATHGFFNPRTTFTTQRMLQSGLILAGSEVLTAFEVMQMDLRGTELVCLSACETGLGEIKVGEGVYGLQRAFKVAGAQSIVLSLWKVNDEATQELMTNFYTNWLIKHQDKRTAFNTAQNTLRKKYLNPYYWGAFVLIGK